MNLWIGFILGIMIALLAWRAGSLSNSGAWAAALTGGLIFGLGGISWAVLLLTFFISSSVISRLFSSRKAALNEKFSKGSRRDWEQVLANGGLGAFLALVFSLAPGSTWVWAAFAGCMAGVNADTWATELGVLSKQAPRLITTWKPVERGTSGGISGQGYLAALGGAALVASAAALLSPAGSRLLIFGTALVGGLVGASADSLVGATVQGIYYCPKCGKETERYPLHSCGTQTLHRRGWRWVSNEVVNFTCSLVAALTAFLLFALIR